jgi:saccharopine dehydrogenase (NAD+, L-lysine-forming)
MRRAGTKRLDLVSIDNLPALLPLQASEQFSNDLLPALLTLPRRHEETVWTDTELLFKRKLREAGLV